MSFFIFLKFRNKHYHIRNKTTITSFTLLEIRIQMLIKCKNHTFLTFFQRKTYFGTPFASTKNENKCERLVFIV
jgi:hypothetical protein